MTMRNEEVAKSFVKGVNAKSKNMFVDGNTVYFYGYHFPIARDCRDYILFNDISYSVSTFHHKELVRREINSSVSMSKKPIIYMRDCNENNTEKQIRENSEKIEEYMKKHSRARKEHTRDYYKRKIYELEEQNKFIKKIIFPKFMLEHEVTK